MNSYISITAKILTHPALYDQVNIKPASVIIPPHRALKPFILNYSLCKFAPADINVLSPCYAHHDTSISFYFANTPKQIINSGTKTGAENIHKISLFGLLTHFRGTMRSEGSSNEFIIKFKPNGFNRLFGIPASKICNTTFPANEVIGTGVDFLHERLMHALDIHEMGLLADKFLTGFLNRRKNAYVNEGISQISHQLLTNPGFASISYQARQANMSTRNFERRFSEQVGTSPKLFCRLVRFNAAIKLKITQPEKSWPDVAGKCGYYDTMHMIKEFKQFANASPTNLFDCNPGFMKEILLL